MQLRSSTATSGHGGLAVQQDRWPRNCLGVTPLSWHYVVRVWSLCAHCRMPPWPLQVKSLIDKIYAVPDGMGGNRRPFKVRTRIYLGKNNELEWRCLWPQPMHTVGATCMKVVGAVRHRVALQCPRHIGLTTSVRTSRSDCCIPREQL